MRDKRDLCYLKCVLIRMGEVEDAHHDARDRD